MKKTFLVITLALAQICTFSFDEKRFPAIKFSNYLASEKLKDCKSIEGVNDVAIDTRMPGFSSNLMYTGKVRKITKKRTKLLESFSKIISRNMHDDYKREIQVSDYGTNYWLPIQEVTYKSFVKVAKKDSSIEVFNRKLGCIFENNQPSVISIIISVRTR